jgi:hypothetical protein
MRYRLAVSAAARKEIADRYSANVLPLIRESQRSGIQSPAVSRGPWQHAAFRRHAAAHGRRCKSLTFCGGRNFVSSDLP